MPDTAATDVIRLCCSTNLPVTVHLASCCALACGEGLGEEGICSQCWCSDLRHSIHNNETGKQYVLDHTERSMEVRLESSAKPSMFESSLSAKFTERRPVRLDSPSSRRKCIACKTAPVAMLKGGS